MSHRVRFQVLIAASVKMAVFWVVAPCSLVEVYRRFRGACCPHYQGDRATIQKTAIFMSHGFAATNRPITERVNIIHQELKDVTFEKLTFLLDYS
jgi:hypothetical protein